MDNDSNESVKSTEMTVEQVQGKISSLMEQYELFRQGPGNAIIPRDVAAGLVELAIVTHDMMSLMYHLCGFAPGGNNSHAMLKARTEHGEQHLTCLQHAMSRVDNVLLAAGFPAHREFPSCAAAPSANAYTPDETNLLYSEPRGNA